MLKLDSALRPPLAVIVFPFLLFHRRAQIAGALAGLGGLFWLWRRKVKGGRA